MQRRRAPDPVAERTVKRTLIIWGGRLMLAALALALGFVGLSLLFSDLGPDESAIARFATTTLFYLLAGLIIGLLYPPAWWLAALVAWGGWLLAIGGLLAMVPAMLSGEESPPLNAVLGIVVLLVLPVGLALVGGYLGRSVRRRRAGAAEPAAGVGHRRRAR